MDMSGFKNRFALRGEVGNGRDNDPEDVLAVKRRLNGLGLYDEPDYGFTGYIDRATEDGIKSFQKKNGLKIDGWLAPGGETEATISDLVDRNVGARNFSADEAMRNLPQFIEGEVGNGRTNNEDDVLAIRQLLTNIGYPGTKGGSPFIDRDLSDAITSFQRDNDLKQDGWLAPGGETERALRSSLIGAPVSIPAQAASDTPVNTHPLSVPRADLLSFGEESEPPSSPSIQVASNGDIPFGWAVPLVKGTQRFARWMGWEEQALKAAEHVADATQKAKEEAARTEAANRDALAAERPAPMENSRGGSDAQAGNDQGIAKCLEMITTHYPAIRPFIEHVGGGTKNGEGKGKVTEFHLRNVNRKDGDHPQLNTSRADWTFYDNRKDPVDPMAYSHNNTQSMNADGVTPTEREQLSMERLIINGIGQLIGGLPKRTKNMTKEDYDKIVDRYCREQMPKWLGPMEKP